MIIDNMKIPNGNMSVGVAPNMRKKTFTPPQSRTHLSVILAEKSDGSILVQKKREHMFKECVFSFPEKVVYSAKDVLVSAQRLLRNQSGHVSGHWRNLGQFRNSGGQIVHFFHATSVEADTPYSAIATRKDGEFVNIFTLIDALATGRVPDLRHASALGLLLSGQERWE